MNSVLDVEECGALEVSTTAQWIMRDGTREFLQQGGYSDYDV